VEVFMLIENQSEPDELMAFRVLRYVVLVYERQVGDWLQTHPNTRGFRFHPVLPLVFYSGTRRWQGARDLARADAAVLRAEVGVLGWVLWLVQQRDSRGEVFHGVLRQVVQQLDRLPEGQHERWEQLLWFVHALVDPERGQGEREQCADFIRATVRAARRAEVSDMRQSIADSYRADGKREALLRLLRL